MPFDPVDPKQRLSSMEEGILQYWREEDTFKRSIREDDETFSFYDGPPFATGLPHYGHLLAGTIKDVIPRYQTMRGKSVQRRFGWDCHGLPVENLIEKEHDIKDKQQIEAMGIGAFNDLCRGAVQRHTEDWRNVVERMGRWVDMDWDYKTMEPQYMESIWWVFSQLHKKGLIYEGRKSMHVCPRCATPLSNFEVTLGYQDITDWTTYTIYPLEDDPNTRLIAWTTTTWTLPGNLFLAVGKDFEYVKVESGKRKTENENVQFIVAKALVEKVFEGEEYEIVETLTAKDLVGKHYTPLFPYFVEEYKGQNAFRIVEADFVTTEDGTGIVHIAPGFGTDDYELGKREGVDVLSHVNIDGTMIDTVTDFAGVDVKPKDDPTKTDKKISKHLEEMGRLFKAESYKHSYPHCWRCDSPLINYSTASWFVAIDKIKEKMLNANSKTQWVPEHVRDGRFGRWLENARDWAISRNRFWGTPLPIWRSEDGEVEVIGSRDQLMQKKQIRFTKVTTLRHAESEGNLIPIYQCTPPATDLTERGQGQAKHAGEWIATSTQLPTTIYCSPLARTKQTAEAIAKQTGAQVIVDDRLREVDFGEYEGKAIDFSNLKFIKDRRAHKIESGKPESIYHFDGMETWDSVGGRVNSFLEEVLPKHRSEHIVVVTHADPMINIEQFFTKEDPVKLSHRPYPELATPKTYFWDHDREKQMDLHMDSIDDITWMGQQSDQSVDLTLVRHGETDWNTEKRVQGHADNPLNDTGKQQAADQAKALKGQTFDVMITSDLSRAKETGSILADTLGISERFEWIELRERDAGEWEGVTVPEILKDLPPSSHSTSVTFQYATPKGGESLQDMLKRAQHVIDKIASEYQGKRVLVVGHNGINRAIRVIANNLSYADGVQASMKNTEAVSLTLHPSYKRIPEVLDCWFESGSMPYAQEHFPFELAHHNMDQPANFPANFIAEGMDQTRGWFYTLTVLGAALFETSPFENCVVNGIVLAKDGKKMSKRLKNYPEPMEVVEKFGADAVRFTLMSSPAVRGEDLRFSDKLVEETVRNVLLPLWNTYSFFVTYANAAEFEPVENRRRSEHPLDVWIEAEVQDLVNRMTCQLDTYDLSATCNELNETIDALTNWYVRLSRKRFASGDGDGIHTLYDVLLTLAQLLAPFCPFITEAIYLNLVPEDHSSVHLTDWPETQELSKDECALLEKTRMMREVVSLGNSIRAEANVKVRQPLNKATIACSSPLTLSEEDLDLLRVELNVKEVSVADNPEDIAESFMFVDARKVGPRLGKRVQEVIQAGKDGDYSVQDDGRILINDEVLSPDEAQLKYRGKDGDDVASSKGIVVALDTTLSNDLLLEGKARDIIRGVQRVRKESGLQFTDEITLSVAGADDVLKEHQTLIESETRSTIGDTKGDSHEIDVGDGKVTIWFCKK